MWHNRHTLVDVDRHTDIKCYVIRTHQEPCFLVTMSISLLDFLKLYVYNAYVAIVLYNNSDKFFFELYSYHACILKKILINYSQI